MSATSNPTFQCDQCGRTMKWSPAIAGKRGKCKCGATIEVPKSIEPPAEEDPLSALDIPLQQVEESNQRNATEAAPPPLSYASAPRHTRSAGITAMGPGELVREIYVPAGVLVMGFGLLLAWLMNQGALFFAAVVTTMVIAGVLMVVKTGALSLFAWGLARSNGGSFGNPLGTILKIAGLVVSLDAVTLWVISIMVMTGAITHTGRFYIRSTLLILFFSTFVVALVVAHLAYRLEGDEAKLFSRFMAGGNLAINVLLLIVLAVIGHAAARSRPARASLPAGSRPRFVSVPSAAPVSSPTPSARVSQPVPAAAAQPGGSPIASAPPPPVPAEIIETNRDRFIWNRVHGGNPAIRKLAAWKTSSDFTDKDAPLARFLDHLSSLGTGGITVDTTESQKGITRIYIELPATVQERDACFTALKEFVSNTPQARIPRQIPNTDRFVEIWLGQFDRFK